MANDLRECFPILEDSVSGFGVAPTRVQVGSSPAGINGMMVLAFKDANGNLVLPQLDPSGRLPTTNYASETYLSNENSLEGGSLGAYSTIATVTLVAGKNYTALSAVVTCTRTTRAQVVISNNGVSGIVGDITVGAGHYNYNFSPAGFQYTAGVSGVQSVYVQAINEDKASPIRAAIGILQTN